MIMEIIYLLNLLKFYKIVLSFFTFFKNKGYVCFMYSPCLCIKYYVDECIRIVTARGPGDLYCQYWNTQVPTIVHNP